MEKERDSLADWLGQQVTCFYIVVMCVVFPVIYTNKMFSLTKDKKYFFLTTTFVYVCLLIPAAMKRLCEFRKEKNSIRKDTVFAGILFLAIVVSTAFAIDTREAFWEMSSRTVCGICFLCFVFLYFGVRAYGIFDNIVIWGWLIGSAVIYLFGIFCACKINFMYIQTGCTLPNFFLTPLGNTNFNACFVSLMLPLVMVMFMLCKERFSQRIYSINLYMGFLFVFFIRTESALLAITAGMFLLAYFAVGNSKWLLRYMQILGIYLGAKVTICLLLHLCKEHLYPFDGIGELVLRDRWVLAELCCFALVAMFVMRKKDFIVDIFLKVRNGMVYVLLALAVVGLFVLIGVNVRSSSVQESSFWSRLVLTNEAFNDRGFIWKGTLKAYKEEPLWRKFFGNGLNCYKYFMPEEFREESLIYLDSYLRDPHNELLQMLVDMGILGVVGYFGLLAVTFVRALRMWRKNELQIVVIITLCVYLLQGLVNGYSIYHLPILFIFLGLANGSIGKLCNEQKSP
ncbi:MAG: O-antigen ligase family protein [Lachnospiraceae bacterium]|nr:O-antigen ligase family protein [Lachnospiraceae bacterium]MCM1258407.1 O-antigen ligase family protein [Roseburia sp.]